MKINIENSAKIITHLTLSYTTKILSHYVIKKGVCISYELILINS